MLTVMVKEVSTEMFSYNIRIFNFNFIETFKVVYPSYFWCLTLRLFISQLFLTTKFGIAFHSYRLINHCLFLLPNYSESSIFLYFYFQSPEPRIIISYLVYYPNITDNVLASKQFYVCCFIVPTFILHSETPW